METPDFAQIARTSVDAMSSLSTPVGRASYIAEQLRLVWNARGAADLVKVEAELTAMMGGNASGPYVKNLERAIRKLDR